MLIEEDMYCAQIARKLGLQCNSTLYHLVLMEKEGLLTVKKKAPFNKKIFYSINRNYIIAIKRYIDTKFIGVNKYENE